MINLAMGEKHAEDYDKVDALLNRETNVVVVRPDGLTTDPGKDRSFKTGCSLIIC